MQSKSKCWYWLRRFDGGSGWGEEEMAGQKKSVVAGCGFAMGLMGEKKVGVGPQSSTTLPAAVI